MDSDEVADDPSLAAAPGMRRASAPDEHHSDDELASVMEEQVSRMTAAIPIIAGPTVVGADGTADAGDQTEAHVAAPVREDLDSNGTPAAIQHLESSLAARSATSAIPVRRRSEPLGRVPEAAAPRDSEPVPVVADVPVGAESNESAEVVEPLAVAAADVAESEPVADSAPEESVPIEPVEPAGDDQEAFPARVPIRSASVFAREATDLEPTPVDLRAGRAARMFWLWFAATSSLVSLGVGATLFTLGLSLRQALVATLVGVGLSFLPLGLGTLAGKWSGQPTMVVSRATFGLRGNALPAVLALITRLFWGAVMLWLAGSAVGTLATAEGWAVDPLVPTVTGLVLAIGAAGLVAYFGYALVARIQLILTIASALLIVVIVAVTWRFVDIPRALAIPDGAWPHVVTGAILVFSYLGLAWANSSAEVARYQRPSSSGAAAMLWATFGAGLPPFTLISYGGLLAASDPAIAEGFASDPVHTLFHLGLPAWSSLPLILAVLAGLISGLVLTIYSGGFTLDALGARLGRPLSTVVVGIAVGVAGAALALASTDLSTVLRGVPTLLAVPVAAWAGLFSAEMMMRTRRFHPPSLLRRGGAYADWRWINLAMLVVASAAGYGLVSSDLPWLGWEGFLFGALGVDPHSTLGMTNLGVIVALVLGILTPLVSALRAVRRQETSPAEAQPVPAQ